MKTVEHFESAGNIETSRQTAFVKIDALFSRAFTRKCRFINQLVQGGKLVWISNCTLLLHSHHILHILERQSYCTVLHLARPACQETKMTAKCLNSFQVLSSPFKSFQVLSTPLTPYTTPFKSCQLLSTPLTVLIRPLSNPFNSFDSLYDPFQILSAPFNSYDS